MFIKDDSGDDDPSANAEAPSREPETAFSLDSTQSHHLFEELTTSYYVPLEVWYIRTSIDKVNLLNPILLKLILTGNLGPPSVKCGRYSIPGHNHNT